MRLQSASYILGAALCLTAPAWAQSTAITPTGTGTQTTSTGTQTTSSTSTGAFQNLSPGGQKIAQSLFDAQHPPTGTKAMTLDQIAALKGKEGWGRAFKEMKSDGLVQARNLGQVVSGHAKTTQATSSTVWLIYRASAAISRAHPCPVPCRTRILRSAVPMACMRSSFQLPLSPRRGPRTGARGCIAFVLLLYTAPSVPWTAA